MSRQICGSYADSFGSANCRRIHMSDDGHTVRTGTGVDDTVSLPKPPSAVFQALLSNVVADQFLSGVVSVYCHFTPSTRLSGESIVK